MGEIFTQVNPVELTKKLGTHTYEIVDISTEWCGPCKEMKKALKKIMQKEPFSTADLHIYIADGDLFSTAEASAELLKQVMQTHQLPMKIAEFDEALKKAILSKIKLTKTTLKTRIIMIKEALNLKEQSEDATIHMTAYTKELLETESITQKFCIDGYPTLIFYKNGTPIQTPLEERDWQSRGIEIYDQKTHKHIQNPVLMDIVFREGEPPTKAIQIDPILEARMVGYSNPEDIEKRLLKFISL